MYSCTTPRWYLIYSFMDISTKNNVTEEKWSVDLGGLYTYEYEYDSDGYPTKRITNNIVNKVITEYIYKEL